MLVALLLELMFKRAIITLGILSFLLTAPAQFGDACGVFASVNHPCCSAPKPEAVESCCATSSSENASRVSADAIGCTCEHPPEVRTVVPLATGADGDATAANADSLSSRDFRSVPRRVSASLEKRDHPPPPAYLLDCAFLT
jgi:hypothetical protein